MGWRMLSGRFSHRGGDDPRMSGSARTTGKSQSSKAVTDENDSKTANVQAQTSARGSTAHKRDSTRSQKVEAVKPQRKDTTRTSTGVSNIDRGSTTAQASSGRPKSSMKTTTFTEFFSAACAEPNDQDTSRTASMRSDFSTKLTSSGRGYRPNSNSRSRKTFNMGDLFRKGSNRDSGSSISAQEPVVGAPLDLEHRCHVQVDFANPVGFSGLPSDYESVLLSSGIERDEAVENAQAIMDILNNQYKGSHEKPIQIAGLRRSPRPAATGEREASRKLNIPLDKVNKDVFKLEDPRKCYHSIVKIGQGSYGSVYKATDARKKKVVAIKTVKPSDEEAWDVVTYETNMMRSIQHENLVHCYEAYKFSERAWIVMEYLDAGSLTEVIEYLDACGLGFDECHIAYILKNILQGLLALHSKGKIHRDVKSDNVLLGLDGSVKLADFGFCTELTDPRAKRNTVIGTPFWMAPEVIRGQKYGTKCDVWSTAILAIECAEAQPPWVKETAMRAMFLIATNGPPRLKDKNAWSAEFHTFMERCTELAPAKRASVEELLAHPFLAKSSPRTDMARIFRAAHQERKNARKSSAAKAQLHVAS
mmetsp:Transcript_21307/g.87095  ORF Transcript_21307/g.87095 Transcript_21307/m.87095 type:complete len:590 (-) Transcript_21307:300-2069(-)|eukprot:CAMPEP_0113960386 /NCGR_PEP_ID=MMETSP0011_2-20120614/4681_1 /TAXON_ID=101924 /ORGANISM="Rhodosorus marinus" /LENGTH=589 /DNA_ID=CAMNT_0000971823 /DNA_START=260 /DNA_END=2029 /DNA_ORIENTATION=- /assembly_acc=CAM_ASM_000156